ncbi:MAG: DUF3793 family protein [Anaerolineae bacterium]|nr:DUF3793 family protein [Anaerolineae bacterium]
MSVTAPPDGAIAPHFCAWKTEVSWISNAEAEFAKWLFVHVAGVLLSEKAGELLTLPETQFGLSLKQRLAHLARLAGRWQCSYMVLQRSVFSTKIILYHEGRVQQALAETPCSILHGQLHYDPGITPTEFLGEVRRRWQKNNRIPHEIGLALGYPVKDVLGFMGLLPLSCLGCYGWRIYDDLAHSMRMSQEFIRAKQRAAAFLSV